MPLRLEHPDLAYQLAPAIRAQVLPGYDPDALERLLQHTSPEWRTEFLSHFLPRECARPGWSHLGRVHDDVLQALLEEVFQPFWDQCSDELLADESMDAYPGRQLAIMRRSERQPPSA